MTENLPEDLDPELYEYAGDGLEENPLAPPPLDEPSGDYLDDVTTQDPEGGDHG